MSAEERLARKRALRQQRRSEEQVPLRDSILLRRRERNEQKHGILVFPSLPPGKAGRTPAGAAP